MRRWSLVALSVAAVGVLAGCGSSASSSSGGGAAATTGGSAASSTVAASSASGSTGGKGLKVGFVYVDPLPGSAWTLAWDRTRQALVQKYGAQTSVIGPVAESPAVVGSLQDLIRKGDKLIFATAIGYQPFVLQVAKQNPSVDFVVTGPWIQTTPQPKNVASVYGNLWEVRYLTGMIAASMSKTGKLGFVSAFSLPSVVAGINGFEQGARAVNPSATTRVVLTGNWYGPPQGTQAAETLAQSGVDVVAKHTDDIGACLGAQQAHIWCIGSEANTMSETPNTFLTGSVYDWTPYAEKKYEQVVQGNFTNEEFNGDLKDGLVALAPLNKAVPASVRAKVAAAEKQIISGKLVIFKGPLSSNTGKVLLSAGQSWTTPAQVYKNSTSYVQGIIGTIQK